MRSVQVDISDPGVTQTLMSGSRPSICRESDGTLHCTYFKWFDTAPIWRIMHGYSSDNGDTWTIEEVATLPADGSAWIMDPSICIDSSDNIYIIWERRNGTTRYLECVRWNGISWTDEAIISWTSSDSNERAYNNAAVDDLDTIHVVFKVTVGGTESLCHIKRNGAWDGSYTIIVSDSSLRADFIALAVDGTGDLHLVYRQVVGSDYILYHRTYTTIWSSATEVVSSTSLIVISDFVADSSDNLHLVYWLASPTLRSYYKTKPSGSSWGSPELIVDENLSTILALDTSQVIKAANYNGSVSGTNKVRMLKDAGTYWLPGIPQSMAADVDALSRWSSLHHLFPTGNQGLTATDEAIFVANVYAKP